MSVPTNDDINIEALAHNSPEEICAMTFKEFWQEHLIINGYEDNRVEKYKNKYLIVYLMIVKNYYFKGR